MLVLQLELFIGFPLSQIVIDIGEGWSSGSSPIPGLGQYTVILLEISLLGRHRRSPNGEPIFEVEKNTMAMRHAVHIIPVLLIALHTPPGVCNDITILGNEYKPPKYYLENGEPRGILVDILRYVDRETDHVITIELYPWKRAYHMAKAGKGGIIGLSMTTERLKIFDYSDVIYYDELLLVVIKGREFPFETIDDLAGKVLGVRRGSIYGDEFDRGRRGIFSVEEDSNASQRLRKLQARRIDVAIIGPGRMGLDRVLRENSELYQHRDEFVVLEKPFARDPNYLGFAKTMKMKAFLHEFNQILQRGNENGTIQQIMDSYSR